MRLRQEIYDLLTAAPKYRPKLLIGIAVLVLVLVLIQGVLLYNGFHK